MEIFTVGNFITLGIVLLILILYRQMDRNSRNRKVLREYSEKIKKELGSFVEEKERAVRDYSIMLNVERESAKELMKRLRFAEEEMAEKAAAVDRIDNQIKGYDKSMTELDRMAGRVQENLNRIRDESVFVETTGKRLAEMKEKFSDLEKGLGGLENRFERENAESLGKTAEAISADVTSLVSDLRAAAETIERQVDEHRQEINKIEETRAGNLARDVEYINNILKNAVEQAGKRADKMEGAALVSLKDQAEDRIRRLKTAEEERLKVYQESAKARVAEIQSQIKGIREEWRAERSDWEAKDKAVRDERRKDMQELGVSFSESEKRIGAAQLSIENRMEELSARTEGLVSSQEALLLKAAEEMKQKALETTGSKLEEYRLAQDAEFRRLEMLTDDSRKLDAELRRSMGEVVDHVREDFSAFRQESAAVQKTETDKFSAAAAGLKKDMDEVEKELSALKSSACENVSEKLKVFEDDFLADLSKRSGDIDQRLLEWQENLETRLFRMGEEAETGRRELERGLTEEMRKTLSDQDERLVSELEHLKAEASAYEEGIRGQMNVADESVTSLKEQLGQNLEEARKGAELYIKSEIIKNSQTAAETIKQYQREFEGKLREMTDYIQTRNSELSGLVDASRSDLEEAKNGLTGKIRELDDSIEEARRRMRDLAAETDGRIVTVRSSVEDAERHIRDAVDQTKLIDKADEIRLEMERRIEDLRGDIDRLDQRRAEAFQLENDFVKIRRLEDDVNAKMTRFLSEKRRIETMEGDFNRLLQISKSVEEKLTQVTASDDTLQAMQLQIRKLEEALGTTEDKYQRIERKGQILDNTNDGIDRNFRALQESEKISSKIGGDLERYAEDLGTIKISIEKLAGESDKAREAADRIDVLDKLLEEVEERISSMQRARQWIAEAETRFEELNRQAQTQARAIDSLVKGKGKKPGPVPDLGEGMPTQQKMENVRILAGQGWKKDEIAKAMKMSLGEVELILELPFKD